MTAESRPVVFCSHASVDKPAVLDFARRLERDGLEAWVDRWEIDNGDDLVARLNDGLDRCTAGLVFFSRHTPRSVWVDTEVSALTYRAVHGLRVVPVLLEADAPVPPLLAHYVRRSVGEYEAIRDTLLGRRPRPKRGALPERRWDELLIRLTPDDGEIHVEVWQGGAVLADETVRRPALLDPSYRAPRTDQALTEVGRACGSLLLPGTTAEHLSVTLSDHRKGDRLDVVVEADPSLLRLPIETTRLPVPGLPLLVGLDGISVFRRPLAPPARLTPALPGPLKILIAVAAPDEGTTSAAVLDGERELARILRALPEHGAQARALEVASLEEITAALRRDSYHVLHLSGHGNTDGIMLEDEDGNPHVATPDAIAAAVGRGNHPLPLVFLSCCDPVTGDDTAPGLALGLLAAGLSQVVAMNGEVSDQYATELAARFYRDLADARDAEPAHALAQARRDLERERQQAAEGGAASVPEFDTATIYCWGSPQPVVGPGDLEPLRLRAAVVPSGPVPRLGVDDLVGRRAEVRESLRVLLDEPRSVRERGQRAGVTLCGVGGAGKSTVAGRVMARLAERGWVVAAVAGPLDLGALCSAVGAALDELDDDGARRLVGQLAEQADDKVRLARLGRAVKDHRLLLVLDNFEDNLYLGGETFAEPVTGAVVTALARSAATGRLLVTSRYPVGPLAGLLHDVRVVPLSRAQARKLLLRLPALDQLSGSDSAAVLRVTGGHPRLMELVDAAMRGNTSRLSSMADRLDRYAIELGVDLDRPRDDLDASMAVAIEVCLRDIALTDLIGELTGIERDVLMQVTVSTIPVAGEAVAAILPVEPAVIVAALERLVRLSVITPMRHGTFFVERWTAQGLKQLADPDEWRRRNRDAAHQRMVPPDERGVDLGDAMEAARNLVEAGEEQEAATLASRVAEFLQEIGQLVMLAGFAAEILAHLPLASQNARVLAEQEADAHQAIGFTDAAEARWRAMCSTLTRLADREPDRADYQRDLSISYERLGDLMVAVGRGEDAARYFQQSLDIRTRLADREPDRADYQRDLSISYERLGDLMEAAGRIDDAVSLYERSLPIAVRLAKNELHITRYQQDLHISYRRLTELLKAAGRHADAAHYQQLADDLSTHVPDIQHETPTERFPPAENHDEL